MIDAILESYRLKDQARTGWTLRGVHEPESVADHSWGTAYLVALYADDARVDRGRSLEMAVVHDLAEARTGDVATRIASLDDPEVAKRKRRREEEAIAVLTTSMPERTSRRLVDLWTEYEKRATPEALFVRDMNLIDMCLQAYVYEQAQRYDDAPDPNFPDYGGLDEFFATTRPRLSTELGRSLFSAVARRYSALESVRARGSASGMEPFDS